MEKIKYLLVFLLFCTVSFADTKKVYFYTTETNINNFKSLKINFDQYLSSFGDYNFQAFNKKETFEKYLKEEDIIVILSSWHYKQISKQYNIKAKLVALKKESITDTKVLIGKKGAKYKGTLTTAFSSKYTKDLVSKFLPQNNFELLNVPKEIDALMSVGFGLSEFAFVSKDSFKVLQKANSFLASKMEVYKESIPTFRMVVASKLKEKYNKKIIDIFTSMNTNTNGQKILSMLRVDDMVILTKNNMKQLGGTK